MVVHRCEVGFKLDCPSLFLVRIEDSQLPQANTRRTLSGGDAELQLFESVTNITISKFYNKLPYHFKQMLSFSKFF